MALTTEAALHGGRYLWGAPTFSQVRVGYEEMQHAARGVFAFNESRMTAIAPNGAQIVFRSLDKPDNARGFTADGVVIDESADVAPDAWYEVLRPMLIDTNGWLWALGTPKGRNWFYQEHQKAKDRDDSACWQAPTLGCEVTATGVLRAPHPLENPNIPFSEIEQLRETLPERTFRQEVLAEFLEDGGGVFRRVMEAATATQRESGQGGQYVIGVDWGRASDFTAICVIDVKTHELVYMDRFNQIEYSVQSQRLQAICERFRPDAVIAESNSIGEPIIDRLRKDYNMPVRGFQTTNATKAQIIDALALAFERGDIRILNDPVLIGELQAYEMERLPSGLIRYGAPTGMHDDTCIALALAWHGAKKTGAQVYSF